MSAPILHADDLTFGYPRHPALLTEWSASFHRGETTAITGPSGRGKSTLLYLLGLMVRPRAGHVRIDGEEVDGRSDAHRARIRAHRYGFVFQDAALDPSRTVLDNVVESAIYRGQPRAAVEETAVELLERFDVQLRARHRPGQVSGGQAQRIALCRALLAAPPIVLADEPTGNLDPVSSRIVVDALREHAHRGAAVIIVTHDEAIAEACDTRIVL